MRLDRGNIGNVKILRSGTDYNISKQLHLAGRDFNWVSKQLAAPLSVPLSKYNR